MSLSIGIDPGGSTTLNAPAFGPVKLTAPMVRSDPPPFEIVSSKVSRDKILPRSTSSGTTISRSGGGTVPMRSTSRMASSGSLLEISSVAETGPTNPSGLNCTSIMSSKKGPRLDGKEGTRKASALGPARFTEVINSSEFPALTNGISKTSTMATKGREISDSIVICGSGEISTSSKAISPTPTRSPPAGGPKPPLVKCVEVTSTRT